MTPGAPLMTPELAQAILREQSVGDFLVNSAYDLWGAGATLVGVVALTPNCHLHSPYFDQIYESAHESTPEEAPAEAARSSGPPSQLGPYDREEAGGPRDRFFAFWLGERHGALDLPQVMDGAAPLLESLLELDPDRRAATSAAERLRIIPFLSAARPTLPSFGAAHRADHVLGRSGRWYGVTGATCDGCGLPCYDYRHSCNVCESFDYCTACLEAEVSRPVGKKEHPHSDFDASRDVSEYRWFETESAAEEARRMASVTSSLTNSNSASSWWSLWKAGCWKSAQRLRILRHRGARVTPVVRREVTL
jgi:hypothetical protein